MYLNCYLCGQPGHIRADCPDRAASRKSETSPRPPADAGPDDGETRQATPARWAEKSRDYAGQAQQARQAMAKTMFGWPLPARPAGTLDREAERWNVRGTPRSRETFGLPHPGDFPGGLPIPPECPRG